jgi:hypothetical protein
VSLTGSQLGPLQPAATRLALALLPLTPADAPAGTQTCGISFVRTASALPTPGRLPLYMQGDDTNVATQMPPVLILGPDAAIAFLTASDAVMPLSSNGVAPLPPMFVDLMFTSTPTPGGLSTPIKPLVRVVLVVSAFWMLAGTGSPPAMWSDLRSFTLRENERLRVPWRELVGFADADAITPDALTVAAMQSEGHPVPPLDYTIAAVAVLG